MDQPPIPGTAPAPPPAPVRGATLQDGAEVLNSAPDRLFREPLRFPGDDGGRSLNEMAARDLEAALQLLAERAQYITAASGAAIALCEGAEMICRASAGPSAPVVGSRAEISSGLSGESVRTGQIVICNDTTTDARVNPESCKAMGIASAMVMPLLRQQRVAGVFELLSSRTNAFEERDVMALQRLGEMIQTAIDHAHAAENAQMVIAAAEDSLAAMVEGDRKVLPDPAPDILAALPASAAGQVERGNIGRCSTCGFPVSEGRTLCLDCNNSQAPAMPLADPGEREAPFAYELNYGEESWLQSHKYLIGTLLAAVITVTAVIFLR